MQIKRGQVALVTGASRGLGVYIARSLAQLGVDIAMAARNEQSLNQLAEELASLGVRTLVVPTDVGDSLQVENLYTRVMGEFGQIDFLINNAGIELTGRYAGLSAEDVQSIIDVNLTGPMRLTQLVLPGMYQRNSGHIVNIASAAGMFPPPYAEPYAATKAGLIAFTQSLRLSAQQERKRVSASVIAPGYMDDAGMYEDMKGLARKPPWYIGSLPAQALADATISAIEKDTPIRLLMPGIPTFLKVLQTIFPGLMETAVLKMGIFDTLVDAADQRDGG